MKFFLIVLCLISVSCNHINIQTELREFVSSEITAFKGKTHGENRETWSLFCLSTQHSYQTIHHVGMNPKQHKIFFSKSRFKPALIQICNYLY